MDIHDSFSHDQSLHIKLQLINAFIMSTGLMQLQEMNNSLTMAGVQKNLANASK